MYKNEVKGNGGIVARVVAKSCSEHDSNIVICTFELEYPRFIHSELMTHRLFSRNAMSSRAVPVKKMIEHVRSNPDTPIHWGANEAGMQAKNELQHQEKKEAVYLWMDAKDSAVNIDAKMNNIGAHKQIVNRLLEPFQMMKTVLTATEFDNFFWLRCHSDAQPEIKELSECMYQAYEETEAEQLKEGEWHTPYVLHERYDDDLLYCTADYDYRHITKEDALKVSSSCCAQVSYRLLDDSLDKALKIYDQLVESKPVHASPFEHQARPMKDLKQNIYEGVNNIEDGVTHIDVDMNAWSGNFKGWVQHRQLIPDNACWEYRRNMVK